MKRACTPPHHLPPLPGIGEDTDSLPYVLMPTQDKIDAWNNNTPQYILDILSRDSESDIRWEVAGNPNTSEKTLHILACDEDSVVRNIALERI